MEHSPERPFVPRPTPTKAQPALGAADFTLSRPFVPGAEKERIAALRIESEIDTGPSEPASLPPIQKFLDVSAPIASSVEPDDEAFAEEYEADQLELPPVEHFIDPLPAVEDFAAETSEAEQPEYHRAESSIANPALADSATTDWVETDWQRYDWRSAAALGDTGENEASNAWASTDWEAPRSHLRPPTPDAIATALDQIAQQLREGDLALPGRGTVSDPATVVATLAALLGIKR